MTTIYTVKKGDSLFSIAKKFNTTVESIMLLNNLNSTLLSIGNTLVIPLYTEAVVNVNIANVRTGPGENYRVLARLVKGARIPVLGSLRGWYKVRIFNGKEGWISQSVVKRYAYGYNKPIISIVGFYTTEEGPTLPSSYNSFVNNTPLISELGLFMFRINRNNPTQIEKFGYFTDSDVETLVAIAHRNNIKILATVHNLLYKPGGQIASKDVVSKLLSTPQNINTFTQNLINLVEQYNLDGINLDIEDVYIEDSSKLSALYTKIGNEFKKMNYFFSGSIPSRIRDTPFNPFSDPFNYSIIGKSVDQFVVMLYNEHGWPGSEPGPAVSINWMNQVLQYTVTRVPPEKVIASVSVFGFDFNLTTGKNIYVTYQMAIQLSKKYNSQIIFDSTTQTPMFSYQDENGNYHEVWFENSDSILAKAKLASDFGISGLGLWRLGMEDPNIWTMLNTDIVVKKL